MADEDDPRVINVAKFVRDRAAQIADLLGAIDNTKLVAGEVTKGPRTAAQRLPRHMRRRAMSHNVKRMPVNFRSFAAPYINSKHRKKPPSRYARRRPRNLLLNYIRRQRNKTWLETHIWHAKRFHIIDRWGYRLPDRSFIRAFRPIYRASRRHCVVRDKSYLTCFLISGPSQSALISLLAPFCSQAASPTFAFKSGLDGRMEVTTLLYRPGEYPLGFIGPARFQWSTDGNRHCLSLWVHPSCREEVLSLLVKKLRLKKTEQQLPEKEEDPTNITEWRIGKMNVHTDEYEGSDEITLSDLRDQLVRVRLSGPLAMRILADLFVLAETDEQFKQHHERWSSAYSRCSSTDFPSGTVFSLLVEDFRLSRPDQKRLNAQLPWVDPDSSDRPIPCPMFWSKKSRLTALEKRITESELNRMKGERLGRVPVEGKVPVLVITRNSNMTGATLAGVDVIVPAGFGMDLWVGVQMRTARASGLRDELAAHLESDLLAFPADAPDARAGIEENNRQREEKQAKYSRRPHNRRPAFWRYLSVKHPYEMRLDELVKDYCGGEKDPSVYVLRDRRALMDIESWLKGTLKGKPEFLTSHKEAIVPMTFMCMARGRPRRFGLVCLPLADDITTIRAKVPYSKKIMTQKSRIPEKKEEEKMEVDTKEVKKDEDKWKDVILFDKSSREEQIPVAQMFPNPVTRALKRKLLNRKKKEKAKRRRETAGERARQTEEEDKEKKATSFKDSADRMVIGRICRGDFSFTRTRGYSIGFVPMACVPLIRGSWGTVLLRNNSSKYYHPAKARVLRTSLDL